jgi:hypothetical protein
MNSSSFLIVLLLVGAALGALLLFSGPSSAPAATSMSTSAGSQPVAPQAATSTESLWVNAGEDRIVGEREAVRLDGSAGSASGGVLTYRWTAKGGLGFFADPTKPSTTYTAPSACDCEQEVTLTLTATNRSGVSSSDSLTLRIRDPLACPERACGEPIAAVRPACPPAVRSTCPTPDVPCAGPCVSQAPSPPVCSQVPVPCRCAEGCAAVWDSAWPQVVSAPRAGDRPTPRIVRQFPSHVSEGSATPLHAVVANPACSSVCFAWSVSQGWLERADTLEPVYHAPLTERAEGERVTITFTIHDSTGQPSYDQIRLQVDNVPSS